MCIGSEGKRHCMGSHAVWLRLQLNAESLSLTTRSTRSSTYSSTTVVVAPPVFSPFGFSPFGGFGYGFMPVPIFGGIFQFLFLAFVVSAVFGVIRSMAASKADKKDGDGWGDL